MLKIALIFLGFWTITVNGQYDITRSNRTDTTSDGKLFMYQSVKKKQSKHFRLHEFYLRIDDKRTYFYPNGEKWLEVTIVTKKGNTGKYCQEISHTQLEYFPNGVLKSKVITNCDCFKEKRFEYNSKGKLTSVIRSKNRWLKRKMN